TPSGNEMTLFSVTSFGQQKDRQHTPKIVRRTQGVASLMPRQNTQPTRFVEPLERRRLLASTISGTIFNDANVDGIRQSTEKPIANQLVYLDLNFNGAREFNEPATVTDSKGQYAFKNLTAGVFRVRTGIPGGYRQTAPGTLYFSVVSNGFDIQVNKDF